MSVIRNIKVYATSPHSCSYLSEREATTLFIDPELNITAKAYGELNELGFRRSGKHFYTPHCKNCSDCVPSRIPVGSFQPSRQQKRVLKRNADLVKSVVEHIDSDEHYQLYARYINARHSEGDMYPPSREQYCEFIGDYTQFSRFTEFRDNGRLAGVNVIDELPGSLSAIYTFFDPELSKRSLGVYSILSTIEAAKKENRGYVYLGYWIRECRKMAYKVDYRPIELLINGRWLSLR